MDEPYQVFSRPNRLGVRLDMSIVSREVGRLEQCRRHVDIAEPMRLPLVTLKDNSVIASLASVGRSRNHRRPLNRSAGNRGNRRSCICTSRRGSAELETREGPSLWLPLDYAAK